MVLVGFVMAMTAPIELLYAIKLGLSTAEVTVFIMVSALGAIVIDVLGTRVITRIDARATIAIGLVLFAASEGCYALSQGATGLFASRLLQGGRERGDRGCGAAGLGPAAQQPSPTTYWVPTRGSNCSARRSAHPPAASWPDCSPGWTATDSAS